MIILHKDYLILAVLETAIISFAFFLIPSSVI